MSIWYAIWDALPFEMLHWDFMKNALLALLLMAPLFGILSTMIVTGRMSFFSDALGHSAFTGIAIGIICGVAAPIWAARRGFPAQSWPCPSSPTIPALGRVMTSRTATGCRSRRDASCRMAAAL